MLLTLLTLALDYVGAFYTLYLSFTTLHASQLKEKYPSSHKLCSTLAFAPVDYHAAEYITIGKTLCKEYPKLKDKKPIIEGEYWVSTCTVDLNYMYMYK